MSWKADTTEIQEMYELFDRRSIKMVSDAVQEGKNEASNRASKRRVGFLRQRRVTRAGGATAVQQAKWIEVMMYRKLVDFFGDW